MVGRSSKCISQRISTWMAKCLSKWTSILVLSFTLTSLIPTPTAALEYLGCDPFTGYLIGASAGVALLPVKGSRNETATLSFPAVPLTLNAQANSSTSFNRTSYLGTVFAGYAFTRCWENYGLEVFIKGSRAHFKNADNATFTITTDGAPAIASVTPETSLRMRSVEYGVDLRPGIVLHPESLVYVRVGAAFNRLSMNSDIRLSAENTGVITPAQFVFSQDKQKNIIALRLGVGLEQHICANWTFRFDYIFTRYQNIQRHSNVSVAFVNALAGVGTASLSGTQKLKLASHAIMVGIASYW